MQDPKTIEILAILRGLQLSMHLGITQLLIESDYQSVVKKIQSNEESTSIQGNLIHDMILGNLCSIFSIVQSNLTINNATQ